MAREEGVEEVVIGLTYSVSPVHTLEYYAERAAALAGCAEMNRIPVVIMLSRVFGIAALTSRRRSQGSSRWNLTDTAMCVLEVKSSA